MTENERLLELLAEGKKIVDFYFGEVEELQGALALLIWDYSGEGHDEVLRDVSAALRASLERERVFNAEDH